MADIPAEAVQAAAAAIKKAAEEKALPLGYIDLACEALKAAAPILAAQVRREERQHAMGVVLRVFSMPGAETHPDVARAIRQIGEAP